jgi:hypothetical protein
MSEMKWLADWLMVRGVNMLMPHAFYYSIRGARLHERPPDVGPNNAWWPHYRLFADYTSRVCGLMADGKPMCDVAILVARNRPSWRAAKYLLENQIDFDYLEEWKLTQKARIEAGRIHVGEMTYSTIILDDEQPPARDVQTHLDGFKQAGGNVVRWLGNSPPAMPDPITRGIRTATSVASLRCLSTRKQEMEFHFLVNEGENAIQTTVTTGSSGRAEWFDPWTGEFAPVFPRDAGNGGMKMTLRLERRQSRVLCIDSGRPADFTAAPPQITFVRALAINDGWRVFDPNATQVAQGLGNWYQVPSLSSLSGTLLYRTSFRIDLAADCTYELSLGHVGDLAVPRLNGRSLGAQLWPPYAWKVDGELQSGNNELEVAVTNSLANRLAPENRRPSGLIGPVVIRERRVSPRASR